MSGTGLIEGGDLLLMPTVGKIKVDPGTYENPDAGYRSRFSHNFGLPPDSIIAFAMFKECFGLTTLSSEP